MNISDFQKHKEMLDLLGVTFTKVKIQTGEEVLVPDMLIDPPPSKIIRKVRVWRLSSEVDGFDAFVGSYHEFIKFCKEHHLKR